MRKVSEKEVAALYQFTRAHYVEYYDVQTELVDHLANGIEAQWTENPEIPFEKALQKEFKKFGVFGFSEVMGKRQRAMEKKYWKFIWKESKSIIREPKMALPIIFLFGGSYFLLTFQEGIYGLMALVVLLFVFSIIYMTKKSAALKRKKKSGVKIYLLETIILHSGGFFSFMWLPFHILNISEASGNFYVNLLMAFLIVIIALTSYICFNRLPKKKDEILKKVHPEMKFS